jgi:hypothetical protein
VRTKRPLNLPSVDLGESMKRKQKLVPVHVFMGPNPAGEIIVPVTGEPIAALLANWRIVQIQPLGEEQGRTGECYAALLLLEQDPDDGGGGRLGFDV